MWFTDEYATFATAILFMIWLYLNWLVLLIGASIAFYRQHPEIVASGLRDVYFNPLLSTRYALSILARIGRRFYDRERAYTLAELARVYDVPAHALQHCLALLVALGILTENDDPVALYLPAVPFDTTTVAEVLQRMDAFQPADTYAPPVTTEPQIAAIEEASRTARDQALAGLTLKQLAMNEVSV